MMLIPFTIFEKYMLLDDQPAYPMDSFRFLHFSGRLNFNLFEASITAVIRLHPMLRSIAREDRRGHFVWEETDQPLFIRKIRGPLATRFPNPEAINLFNEPGFRVYFVEERNRTLVLFQFHHSVSDGIGEMEVIADILSHYVICFHGGTPSENPRNLDPSLLQYRGSSGLTLAKYFRFFFSNSVTTNRLLFRFPEPLAPHVPLNTNIPAKDYLAFCSGELTLEETQHYFDQAKTKQVTVNDLLLRDLFLTMGVWRQKWFVPQGNPWLRISMPMNLRTESLKNMPAANAVTMLFLDRQERDFSDQERLLKKIHQETDWIKRREQKHVLLLTLKICDLLPGGIASRLNSPKCRATSVLSNLGRVFESLPFMRRDDGRLFVGNAVLEEVDATPPIRPGTLISFSTLTYANRLRLILRYDAKNITTQQADDLLNIFFSLLKSEPVTK
ncbi:MAG: condensation domain-containing protein [Planctomycetaceae bacterium]|jgi:NRPS condensation-like uncharacterized protein|nr:condensation domain-containing protein [Planctomycetaceae bacterium]